MNTERHEKKGVNTMGGKKEKWQNVTLFKDRTGLILECRQ